MSGRIGIVFKWAFFLFLLSFVIQFVVGFLFAIILALLGFDQNYIQTNAELAILVISSIVLLPFVYWFCLKAAREAYQKKVLGPKQRGINITMSVVAFTILLNVVASYLLTGEFNIGIGILPIIIAFLAGQKADTKK